MGCLLAYQTLAYSFSVSARQRGLCLRMTWVTLVGVLALRLSVGPAVTSSALSADESSSSEAAGEKTEQNDDDTVKSQEVRCFSYLSVQVSSSTKNSASVCSYTRSFLNAFEVGLFLVQRTAFHTEHFISVILMYFVLCVFIFSQHLYETSSCQPHGVSPDLYLSVHVPS